MEEGEEQMLCSECNGDMVVGAYIGSDGWLLMNCQCPHCGAGEVEVIEEHKGKK